MYCIRHSRIRDASPKTTTPTKKDTHTQKNTVNHTGTFKVVPVGFEWVLI